MGSVPGRVGLMSLEHPTEGEGARAMNATDTRTPRTICPRCGVRLCVDGEALCLQCLDKTMLARQSTLSQRRLA